MPSTTGSTASRWLGLGGIDTTRSSRSPPRIARSAPAWYFTSPVHAMSSRKCARHRLLELRQDLRVRLVEHVRHHVQPAAVRHADQDVADARLGRLADHLVQHRDEHVEPFDREARLAGEGAVQEALEGLDLRQPVEQRRRVDRIGRGAEAAGLRRLAQPLALGRHEHVRVVVAGRRTVDARAAPRSRRARSRPGSISAPDTRLAGSARRSWSVSAVRLGQQRGIAGRTCRRAGRAAPPGARSGGSIRRG